MTTLPTVGDIADRVHDIARDTFANYRPTAHKRGRNPRFPYVPVVLYPLNNRTAQRQLLARAFATRAEAVSYAERAIRGYITGLERDLMQPSHKAHREQYGLPRDIDAVEVAWSRKESEPCERNTPGCCVRHSYRWDEECATW